MILGTREVFAEFEDSDCYYPHFTDEKADSQTSNTTASCRTTLIGSEGIKPLAGGYHLCP